MKRYDEPSRIAASAVAPPVHHNGQTETERVTGHNQYGDRFSELTPRATTSKSSMLRFLLVSALAFAESLFYRNTDHSLTYLSAATCFVFILLALKYGRAGRTGALAALGLLAVSTTAMAVLAMTSESGIALVATPLIARFVLLFLLYRGFELQDEEQVLQNSH